MRALLALSLLAALFAGCAQSSDTQPTVANPAANYQAPAIPAFDAVNMLADHADFVRNNNERALNKPTHESARQELLSRFASYGLETYRQNFTSPDLVLTRRVPDPPVVAPGLAQSNILGIKWGVDRTSWVVVGAHYDTVTDDCALTGKHDTCPLRAYSEGAYDDGSGTLITVHLARAFANVSTYHTVAFVAYDGEERGTEGARAFVNEFIVNPALGENYTQPYGPIKVVAAIDLDMIGLNWPGTWNPVNVITNSEALYQATLNKTGQMGFPQGQVVRKDGLELGSSDYARFWEVTEEKGGPIPTIFFISAFEEVAPGGSAVPVDVHTPAPAGAYPFWHLQDTVETMRTMAGDPPADGLPHPNLEKGFQAAGDIALHLLHLAATTPDAGFDAVVMS